MYPPRAHTPLILTLQSLPSQPPTHTRRATMLQRSAKQKEKERRRNAHFMQNISRQFTSRMSVKNVRKLIAKLKKQRLVPSKEACSDVSFWREVMGVGAYGAWLLAPASLRSDKRTNFELLLEWPDLFPYIGAPDFELDMKDMDKAAALDAVSRSWWVFKFLPAPLKQDREIIFKAMESSRANPASIAKCVLELVPDDLQNDKDIVCHAVKAESSRRRRRGYELYNYSREFTPIFCLADTVQAALFECKDIVFSAITHSPNAGILEQAKRINSKCALLDDEEVVRHALSLGSTHSALANFECASDRLKSTPAIVLAAIEKNARCFMLARANLKGNKEFVLQVIHSQPEVAPIPEDVGKDHRDFYGYQKHRDGQLSSKFLHLAHLPDHLKTDKDVISAAVTKNYHELKHCTLRTADKDIATIAVAQGGLFALNLMHSFFKEDVDLWRIILSQHPIVTHKGFETSSNPIYMDSDDNWHYESSTYAVLVCSLSSAPANIRANKELAAIAAWRDDSFLKHITWAPPSNFWSPTAHPLLFRKQREVVKTVLSIAIRLRVHERGYMPDDMWLRILRLFLLPTSYLDLNLEYDFWSIESRKGFRRILPGSRVPVDAREVLWYEE